MNENRMLEDLERSQKAAFSLLLGLGRQGVREAVDAAGVTPTDIAAGSKLVSQLLPPTEVVDVPAATPGAQQKKDAIEKLLTEDERLMRITRAVGTYEGPNAAAWILGGLEASPKPDQSVATVGAILARLAQLEAGAAPKDKDIEPGFIEALAKRKLGKQQRDELQALVEKAIGDVPVPEAPAPQTDAERLTLLLELDRWYDMVSGLVIASKPKKQVLISLGLASRKKPKPPTSGGGGQPLA